MMQFDVNRLMQVMSEIMSDKYDLKITFRAVTKEKEGNTVEMYHLPAERAAAR